MRTSTVFAIASLLLLIAPCASADGPLDRGAEEGPPTLSECAISWDPMHPHVTCWFSLQSEPFLDVGL